MYSVTHYISLCKPDCESRVADFENTMSLLRPILVSLIFAETLTRNGAYRPWGHFSFGEKVKMASE